MHKSKAETAKQDAHWPQQIFHRLIEHRIEMMAYVPDAGHCEVIDLCLQAEQIESVKLTTEEEGIALAAGAWLGGKRCIVLMQSSGIGNCVNMFSLIQVCRFPMLLLIAMRGEWEEFNPWQIPLGEKTETYLKLAGIQVVRVDEPLSAGNIFDSAAEMSFADQNPAAVLLSQKMIGAKTFD